MKRRDFVKVTAIASCSYPLYSLDTISQNSMLVRNIPSTNEPLPAVGLGTWQSFDVGSNLEKRSDLIKVLETLRSKGGSLVDSSPMYGRSEKVVGELSEKMGINSELFVATKVWTTGKEDGINQMDRSIELMRKRPLDLMQIHNLQDWLTHFQTLRDWKAQGKVRYIGITHYVDSAFPEMEKIMKAHPIDFIQLNYSMGSLKAEESILPLALDKGIAVLINRPYKAGSLFGAVKEKTLPDWVKNIDINSWGQFFLKYILSNPAVTCVIPGTSKPHHMLDNMMASYGRLPNDKERQQMLQLIS